MNNYIFRNYTIEPFFEKGNEFSGYGDINIPDTEYDCYTIFYQLNPAASPEYQLSEITDVKTKIDYLKKNIQAKTQILIFTLRETYNNDWTTGDPELLRAQREFNTEYLSSIKRSNKNITTIDINSFRVNSGMEYTDWKYLFLSQIVINPKLAKSFKQWFHIQLNSIKLIRKKCLVLDCDNTLWGGIVGEEGIHGIDIGEDYPGSCYRQFQRLLEMAASKGIILAICSKNNEKDVFDVWDRNRNNILNRKHISAYRINWENKVSNIKSLADELNISLDSMVFIDDNPAERNLVSGYLPDVTVPDFPKHPYNLAHFFWKIYNEFFIADHLSSEDLNKTTQYKENLDRREAEKTFNTMDDYLRSLDITIDIFAANDSNVARIAQMTQKTNQFNLTTKRYSEANIREFIRNKYHIYCAGIRDKFGDNGITISCIIDIIDNGRKARIDSYLLSCRILGRKIEEAFLAYILNQLYTKGVRHIYSTYNPTKKNIMAAVFYEKIGFKVHDTTKDGEKCYLLEMNNPLRLNNNYKINYHGE